MSNICPLSMLNIGQSGKVTGLSSSGTIRRRLQDIGLIEGTYIKCVLKSPGGDPMAYQIRGAIIALRNEDTSCVQIRF